MKQRLWSQIWLTFCDFVTNILVPIWPSSQSASPSHVPSNKEIWQSGNNVWFRWMIWLHYGIITSDSSKLFLPRCITDSGHCAGALFPSLPIYQSVYSPSLYNRQPCNAMPGHASRTSKLSPIKMSDVKCSRHKGRRKRGEASWPKLVLSILNRLTKPEPRPYQNLNEPNQTEENISIFT